MRNLNRTFGILLLSVFAASCSADITSPDGRLRATVEGQTLTVYSDKSIMLDNIHLGLMTESDNLDSALVLKSRSKISEVKESYSLKSGKAKKIEYKANSQVFTFQNPEGKSLGVELRLMDDGFAFRYILDENTTVVKDCSAFYIPDGTNRWVSPHVTDYEQFFPLSTDGAPVQSRWPRLDPGKWSYPALFEVGEGQFALISESDVKRGNSASSLDNSEDMTTYKVLLTSESTLMDGMSPWRFCILGDLATVVESNMVTDLAEECAIVDTNWIEPGVSSWIYWAYNHSSKDYAVVKEYIDLAARMGWKYSLIDWEWPEMSNGGEMEDALGYALENGVLINLWYNSGTSWIGSGAPQPQDRLITPEARQREMTWLEGLGVTGIKVDFFSPDGKDMVNYYIDILEDAAVHHLLVDFHGCTIPRGWRRTYPNLMSMEAVYGAEWYNNGPVMTTRAAEHNATLPFTRNVIGPMDYTPGTFSDSQFPHVTTNAHELALPVLFESGLQHMPDRPSSYDELDERIKEVLKGLVSDWDETLLLTGYPGKSAVIARRSESTWYIAGINGTEDDMELSFSLSRLKADGKSVLLVADGDSDREFSIKEMDTPADLTVPCRPRGGFLAVIR